jgi:hypothetical protein
VSEEPFDEIVERVKIDRRAFVRRLAVGSAFAIPVITSFDMNTLSMNLASGQSNQTSP